MYVGIVGCIELSYYLMKSVAVHSYVSINDHATEIDCMRFTA